MGDVPKIAPTKNGGRGRASASTFPTALRSPVISSGYRPQLVITDEDVVPVALSSPTTNNSNSRRRVAQVSTEQQVSSSTALLQAIEQEISDSKVIKAAIQDSAPQQNWCSIIRIAILTVAVLAILASVAVFAFGQIRGSLRKESIQRVSFSHEETRHNNDSTTCGYGTYPRRGLCAPNISAILEGVSKSYRSSSQQQCPLLDSWTCSDFSRDPLNANRDIVLDYLSQYGELWAENLLHSSNSGESALLARIMDSCKKNASVDQSVLYSTAERAVSSVRDWASLAKAIGLLASLDIAPLFELTTAPDPRRTFLLVPLLVPAHRFFSEDRAPFSATRTSRVEREDYRRIRAYLDSLYRDSVPVEYRQQTLLAAEIVSYAAPASSSSGSGVAAWSNLSRDLLPLPRLAEILSSRFFDLDAFLDGYREGLELAVPSPEGHLPAASREWISRHSDSLVWLFRSDFFLALSMDQFSLDAWRRYLSVALAIDPHKVSIEQSPTAYMPSIVAYEYDQYRPCQQLVRRNFALLIGHYLTQDLSTPGGILDPAAGARKYLDRVFNDLTLKLSAFASKSGRLSAHAKARIAEKLSSMALSAEASGQDVVKFFVHSTSDDYHDLLLSLRACRRAADLKRLEQHNDEESGPTRASNQLRSSRMRREDILLPTVYYHHQWNTVVIHPLMLAPMLYPPASDNKFSMVDTLSRIGWFIAREISRAIDRYGCNFDPSGQVSLSWLYEASDIVLYDSMYASFSSPRLVDSPGECIADRLAFCSVYGVLLDHSGGGKLLYNNSSADEYEWVRQMFWSSSAIRCRGGGDAARRLDNSLRDFYLYERAFSCVSDSKTRTSSENECVL